MKTIIENYKKNRWLLISILLIGIILGYIIGKSSNQQINKSITTSTHPHIEQSANQTWTCSMHPQIKQNKPGLCPICAMDLVPMESGSVEGEHVDPNEIQMTKSALALASVQTTVVMRGVPEKNIQLLGKVKADERNISELTARFGGRIEKLLISYTGQQVRKGQKLGTIYSPELITAQKELLEALKFKRTNPSFYKTARTKLKLWDLSEEQIDAIENNGEPKIYFEILSPITGTVTKKHITIGDYVKEGSALFEVIDLSKLWVMFDAYESDLPWIKKGDQIEFTIQSIPGETFNGKVSYIDPFIDAGTRVAQVRVELNNPKQKLKPEMFASGTLKSHIADNINEILIPKSSILWTGKRSVVYVKVPERETASFIYREITLGAESGNFYVVANGLSEGEEIASNGVFKIDAAAQLAGKSSMMNPTEEIMQMKHHHGKTNKQLIKEATVQHSEFKVAGNCGMCKNTIETATKSLEGVNFAIWDQETKMLKISYNGSKISLEEIHKIIAKAGYDTEKATADQTSYDNLPACCKYKE